MGAAPPVGVLLAEELVAGAAVAVEVELGLDFELDPHPASASRSTGTERSRSRFIVARLSSVPVVPPLSLMFLARDTRLKADVRTFQMAFDQA